MPDTFYSACAAVLLLARLCALSAACYVFPTEVADPCRLLACPFGARCVADGAGVSARCECPTHCPLYGDHAHSRPVCGSDARDYPDQCHLDRQACATSTHISVKFHGPCDPCADVRCAEGEVCQVRADRTGGCACGDACSLELTPVCASDGKTYANECALRTQACRDRTPLRVVYRGQCGHGVNPCASVDCAEGERCAIDKFGIARCACSLPCEPLVRPVCGDDARTYESACELRRAACAAKRRISVKHDGPCGSASPCSTHACDFGAVCVVRGGAAHCECALCPLEFAPVCGSDGVTYNNLCTLQREGCQHRRVLRMLYSGLCNGCEGRKCEHYAVCESDGSGNSECVCPAPCESFSAPVCGSDGVTYKNECELRAHSCRAQLPVVAVYKGDCDLCVSVRCTQGARCEAGECVCPTDCADEADAEPLCASNMATYRGECELRKARCADRGTAPLTVLFYGECRDKLALTPATSASPQPASASASASASPALGNAVDTGVGNEASSKDACRDVRCDFEASCEVSTDGLPRCACHFDCAQPGTRIVSTPVCASDLKLYATLCDMKMEACLRQSELRLRPLDLCRGMEVRPCNGGTPLVDASGREFDCGHGPGRQDCPPGAYCHQTSQFAKCCHKDGVGSAGGSTGVGPGGCESTWFGCCSDGKTPAQGQDGAGCPAACVCHRLGTLPDAPCPTDGTEQCACKPGVGGERCDRCEPGFWGLPKISEGRQGCIPCACSVWGSVRDDCEQMTGRCVCKPGIQGQKCTVCTGGSNRVLGPHGCVKSDAPTPTATSCSLLECYFSAICEEHHGHAECVCRASCADEPINTQVVCGNDGQTYGSECQLKLFSCRYQKDIVVQALGACKEEMFSGTEWPPRRSTEPGDVGYSMSKSTRHLLLPGSKYQPYSSLLTLQPRIQPAVSSVYHAEAGEGALASTTATLRAHHALLGDLCAVDDDCAVVRSRCIAHACVCHERHTATSDRQHCTGDGDAPAHTTREWRACVSQPCLHGGACADGERGEFSCACAEGFLGPRCEQRREFSVPAFDGRSYVRLAPLKANNKLSVEIEFKAHSLDGLLLYGQQQADGTGDFVSLALVDGFVEFRYNLGAGAVSIRSMERVELRAFHRVVAKRYHRDGLLKLDDAEDVVGQSPGTLKSLDLADHAYVGYVPTNVTRVFENAGTSSGLVGCVRRLRIGRRTVELRASSGADELVLSTHGLRECGEDPCSVRPCRNAATCHALDAEQYMCACAPGHAGAHCEVRVDPCASSPCAAGATCSAQAHGGFQCRCPEGLTGALCRESDWASQWAVPDFPGGGAYLQLPRLEGVGRACAIEVWFLARAPDGVLLYNGQHAQGGKGDFIAVLLAAGRLHFRFDLGSGAASLQSAEEVSLGRWHVARATRVDKEATLQLDNGSVVTGSSGPPLNELNLELPLFVGGVPSVSETSREAGLGVSGLDGIVQRVLVNAQPLPGLHRTATWPASLRRYDAHPACRPPPCANHGVCQPRLETFDCSCAPQFTGVHCETQLEADSIALPIKLTGETFHQYQLHGGSKVNESWVSANTSLPRRGEARDADSDAEEVGVDGDTGVGDMYDEDDVEFFHAEGGGGVNGGGGGVGAEWARFEVTFRSAEADGLLLWTDSGQAALALVDGFLELSFRLGNQMAHSVVRSKVAVGDGAWHSVTAQLRRRGGSVSVDGELPVRAQSPQGEASPRLGTTLFLGGAPALPSGLPSAYYLGFHGCVDAVRVDHRAIDLRTRSDNDKMAAVLFCDDNHV